MAIQIETLLIRMLITLLLSLLHFYGCFFICFSSSVRCLQFSLFDSGSFQMKLLTIVSDYYSASTISSIVALLRSQSSWKCTIVDLAYSECSNAFRSQVNL